MFVFIVVNCMYVCVGKHVYRLCFLCDPAIDKIDNKFGTPCKETCWILNHCINHFVCNDYMYVIIACCLSGHYWKVVFYTEHAVFP